MGRISSFVTGAALGVIAALLLAPQTGEQTRALVAEKANAVTDEAKDFGAGMPGSAQDAFKTVYDKGAALIKDAPSKIPGAAQSPATNKPAAADSDELREKIEAARKRIAAQVMENAEQTKETASSISETAAENVETIAASVEKADEAKHAAK